MDSSRIGLLARVAELARRNGLRPSEFPATIRFEWDDGTEVGKEILNFTVFTGDQDKLEKIGRMKRLLGIPIDGGGGTLSTEYLSEMEDIVERAIDLSPRSRTR